MCCNGKYIFDEVGRPQTPLSNTIMRNIYGKLLMKNPVRILVLVIFGGLIGLNCYAVSQIEVKFDLEWFISDDFVIAKARDIRDTYFGTNVEASYFYTIGADFEEEQIQIKYTSLEEAITSCQGCREDWIVEGSYKLWYSAFKDWINRGSCSFESSTVELVNGIVPSQAFYYCLLVWQQQDEAVTYSNLLAWNDDFTKLKGAMIEVGMVIPDDSDKQIEEAEDAREIGDIGPEEHFLSVLSFCGQTIMMSSITNQVWVFLCH